MYQACNWSYFLKYICGWRPEKKKDAFRIGSHWAKCQEIASLKTGALCIECASNRNINPDCYLCEGTGTVPEEKLEIVSRYLELVYGDMPANFNREIWDTEKLTLLYSFCGYKWVYPQEDYEVIACEIPFSLPIIDPVTGRKLAKCRLDGVIDQLWRHKETGTIVIGEQKSTGTNLDDGDYWEKLELSGQVQTYSYAVWMLWVGGALKRFGLEPSDAQIVRPVYDVWKKPGIKPKKLSAADSKKLVETGVYCGENFNVLSDVTEQDENGNDALYVNGRVAQVDVLKKGFAIHETPEMYAERLNADMAERPGFYFARKEIPVDDKDLEKFANDCAKIVKTIRYIEKEDLWIRDSRGCKNPGKCDYYDACHSHKDFPCGVEMAPEGYKTVLDSVSLSKKELEDN
jgi:hypothetical protein